MHKDRKEYIFDGRDQIGAISYVSEDRVIQIVLDPVFAQKYEAVIEIIVKRLAESVEPTARFDKERFCIENVTPFFYYAITQEMFTSQDLLVRSEE